MFRDQLTPMPKCFVYFVCFRFLLYYWEHGGVDLMGLMPNP